MESKGQLNVIIAAVVIGAVLVVGLYVIMPRVSGGSGPEIPGVTEKVVKSDLDVTVKTRYWSWESDSVDIDEQTIRTYEVNQLMAFGPLWANRTIEGELIVESILNGSVQDEMRKNYEVTETWNEAQEEATFTFNGLELGEPDSGTVKIRVTMYNDKGEVVDTDSSNVTI